jgi:hypothetical protein
VSIAVFHATPCRGPDGTGRTDLHGAHVVEAIEDTPHGLVVTGMWREGLAQEQLGVLVGKTLFQPIQRTAATERIQHEAEHDGARVHVHLGGHEVVDEPDEVKRVSVGFDNREMCNRIGLDRVRCARHGSPLRSNECS